MRLLEAALSYYQDFIDQSRDDPTIQTDLGVSRAKITTILGHLTTLIRSYQYIPLHREDVQDELQLSQSQRKAIELMHKNWMDRSHEAMRRGPEERERRRLQLAHDQEAKVAQLLTNEQLRRFKQIALQFIGPLAFSAPDVVNALQLTTSQKKQLRTILDQAGSAATKFGPRGGAPAKEQNGPTTPSGAFKSGSWACSRPSSGARGVSSWVNLFNSHTANPTVFPTFFVCYSALAAS